MTGHHPEKRAGKTPGKLREIDRDMYFEARAGRTAVLGASKVQREFGTHQINKNKNNPRQQPKKQE